MHYRWHPLVGQSLPVLYREQRRGEQVAICEFPDGSRAVVPAWMLERAACATLMSGAPQVSLEALRDLRRLLDALSLERFPADAAGSVLDEDEHLPRNENGTRVAPPVEGIDRPGRRQPAPPSPAATRPVAAQRGTPAKSQRRRREAPR